MLLYAVSLFLYAIYSRQAFQLLIKSLKEAGPHAIYGLLVRDSFIYRRAHTDLSIMRGLIYHFAARIEAAADIIIAATATTFSTRVAIFRVNWPRFTAQYDSPFEA
jgi:hypothetical protein